MSDDIADKSEACAWRREIFLASESCPQERLGSGHQALDDFFSGGLPWGAVTEWGVPLGRGGRRLVAAFVASATKVKTASEPSLVLWVYATKSALSVYPPAFLASGIDLSWIRFVATAWPLRELKPVFLDPLFKVIVLDSPERLTGDDLAFVAHQARANTQAVLVLRNYLLSPKSGNVWARVRLNAWQEAKRPGEFVVKAVRGLSSPELRFKYEAEPVAEGDDV